MKGDEESEKAERRMRENGYSGMYVGVRESSAFVCVRCEGWMGG